MSAPLADKFPSQHLHFNCSPGCAAKPLKGFLKAGVPPARANLQLLGWLGTGGRTTKCHQWENAPAEKTRTVTHAVISH